MLINRQADGLIISSAAENAKEFIKLQKENYPFVLIDRYLDIKNANFVSADNYQGAFTATEHIIKQNIKDIAFLSITPIHISTIKNRIKGYKDALKKHNIKFQKTKLISIDFNNINEDTNTAIDKLIGGKSKIQAIFASNNNIAIACMRSLNRKKMKIPNDVALLSFDDIDLFEFSRPKITSVSQSASQSTTK